MSRCRRGKQTISLTGIAHTAGSGAITVTAKSDSTALVPTVNYVSPNTTGTVTFTPTGSGVAHVVVTVSGFGRQHVRHRNRERDRPAGGFVADV